MNHVQKIHFPVSAAILHLFSALSAALIIYELTKGAEANKAGIVCFLIIIIAATSVGGVNTAVFVRAKRTVKYGEEVMGRLADYAIVSQTQGGSYYLVIGYTDNGVVKSYKTKANFYSDEFRFLRRTLFFKIKHYRGYVVITEPFPDEIYKRTVRRR